MVDFSFMQTKLHRVGIRPFSAEVQILMLKSLLFIIRTKFKPTYILLLDQSRRDVS